MIVVLTFKACIFEICFYVELFVIFGEEINKSNTLLWYLCYVTIFDINEDYSDFVQQNCAWTWIPDGNHALSSRPIWLVLLHIARQNNIS